MAMEGPTPVSALIHAATLVTAGVYLMLRTAPLLEYGPTALVVITWLGATTAFFAATCGLVAGDAKRVIAYSTCSQLGYMFMAVGLSQYGAALYHLVTHAVFKALLFMAAGSVIHAMADQQDLRRLGGLVSFLPLTYAAMLVGTLSLVAVPGMTGFYSKDALLELAAGTYTLSGSVVYALGTATAGITSFYSFRLLALVFHTTPSAPSASYSNTHDAPALLAAPLLFLGVLAIVFGYIGKDLWLGVGTDYLSAAFHMHPASTSVIEAEFGVATYVKLMPAIVTFLGAGLAMYMYHGGQSTLVSLTESRLWRTVHSYLVGQWRWNALITNGAIRPALGVGLVASKVLDRGLVETVGPYGLSTVLPATGRAVAGYDTSLVTTYALYVMLGLLAMVTILYAPVVLSDATGTSTGLLLVYLSALVLLPSRQRS
nr:NADH dehydrogenase subunit 5, mitochondrial [Tanacetum cinerariifolium]